MGEARPVETDEHPVAVGARHPLDGPVQRGDVVGGVVQGRVARPRADYQHVVDVVADRQVRAEAGTALVGRRPLFLLGAGEHERRVQVHHRDPGQLPAGDRQPREALRPGGQQPPPAAAERGDGPVQPGEGLVVGLVEEPPDRRGRGHRPGHRGEVAQALEVADRLPAGQQCQREVDRQLAPVVERGEPAPRPRGGQRGPQAGFLGQKPDRQQPDGGDKPVVVADELKSISPCGAWRSLHGRGAPASARSGPRQITSLLVRCTSITFRPGQPGMSPTPVKDGS